MNYRDHLLIIMALLTALSAVIAWFDPLDDHFWLNMNFGIFAAVLTLGFALLLSLLTLRPRPL